MVIVAAVLIQLTQGTHEKRSQRFLSETKNETEESLTSDASFAWQLVLDDIMIATQHMSSSCQAAAM